MADLFLEQTKVFAKKLKDFHKKLKVMEATCLRLPPKNRAKNKLRLRVFTTILARSLLSHGVG